MKLIFDSNVFDDLTSGKLKLETIKEKNHEVFITHIQVDEINKCSDEEKRARLFNVMTRIRPEKIPTESLIFGTSRLGSAKLGDGNLIEELRMGNYENTNDALIGETAIKNNLTLVTNDKKFKNKVVGLGGVAMTVNELLTEKKS